MHSRRLIAFVMGFWLAGLLIVAYVASLSFRTVDSVMANPPHEASQWMDVLGKERSRTLLRHGGAEVNRSLFETWGHVDVALCVLLMILFVFNKGTKATLILTGVLLLLGLASAYLLTPQVISVGRLLDFRPPQPIPPERAQFSSLHGMYSGLALIRMVIAGAIAVLLIHRTERSGRRRSSRLDEVDPINHPNNRHVDRRVGTTDRRHGAEAFGDEQD